MATATPKHHADDGIERAASANPDVHRALVVVDPPMHGRDVANIQRATRERLRARGIGAKEVPVPEHGKFTAATALACIEAQYFLGLASATYLMRDADGHRVLTEGAQHIIRSPRWREPEQIERARERRGQLEQGPRYYEELALKMGATGKGVAGALKFAAAQVGVQEQPLDSNWGPKIKDWITATGYVAPVPWCGCFVNACIMAGGLPSGTGWIGYTPAIVSHAKAGTGGWSWHGPESGKPGDLALFDRPGGDPVEHVEIVRAKLGAGHYSTFGGNTSDDNAGSQFNGHMVAQRDDRRTTGSNRIVGFARPPWK